MSWSSRFPSWGRFSPFSSSYGEERKVTADDFSYITAEDLAGHSPHHTHHASTSSQGSHHRAHNSTSSPHHASISSSHHPPRDDDVLVLRHNKVSYPLRFEPYIIDDNVLTIGALREAAARKLPNTNGDRRRVRLYFRGRNLRDDERGARDEGLRSEDEILCVVGDPLSRDGEPADESDDNSAGEGVEPGEPSSGKKKRNRTRNKRKKRGTGGGSGNNSGASTPLSPNDSIRAEHLPIPASLHPSHRPSQANGTTPSPLSHSRQPSPAPPQTAQQKLDALASKFQDHVPACEAFIANPPTEKAKRDYDHKRLTETILQQILFKLDAVETEGDEEARARRKELVRNAQGMLTRLDEVAKV